MTTETMTLIEWRDEDGEMKHEKMTAPASSEAPRSRPPLPGPNAKRVLARRREIYFAVLYTLVPAGGEERPRHCGHRRGRQRVFRFFRRHRRDLHRPLPSASGRRYSEAGGRTDPHVGHGFLLREHGELAARLSKIAPMRGPHRIYYGNSGAEAIECALKLARYHTKRQNVIAFSARFTDARWARFR